MGQAEVEVVLVKIVVDIFVVAFPECTVVVVVPVAFVGVK